MHEDLVDAAIREVEEETNIKTKFESMLSGNLIHTHPSNHLTNAQTFPI